MNDLMPSILSLSAEAKARKSLGENIIDATTGMLFDEDNHLYSFKSVAEAENAITFLDKYAYSSLSGDEQYLNLILKHIFNKDEENNCFRRGVASPGGSGALSLLFSTFLKTDETIICGYPFWDPYLSFAAVQDLNILAFPLYKDDNYFNKEAFLETLSSVPSINRKIILLNDPSSNPTGFSLSTEDYKYIVNKLNEISNKSKVILIMDIAYLDFANKEARSNLLQLNNLNENIDLYYIFSASKTFSLYGTRTGALIYQNRNLNKLDDFVLKAEKSVEGMWSCAPSYGMHLVSYLLGNDLLNKLFQNELEEAYSILKNRAKTFLKEALKYNLKTSPYTDGFYILVITSSPIELCKKLIKKGVYTCPLKDGIRIALSSINLKESKQIVKIIKEVMEGDK